MKVGSVKIVCDDQFLYFSTLFLSLCPSSFFTLSVDFWLQVFFSIAVLGTGIKNIPAPLKLHRYRTCISIDLQNDEENCTQLISPSLPNP